MFSMPATCMDFCLNGTNTAVTRNASERESSSLFHCPIGYALWHSVSDTGSLAVFSLLFLQILMSAYAHLCAEE